MLKNIEEVADLQCPIRKFSIANYRPDWITNELQEQIRDRDFFYKKAKQTKNEDYWNIAKFLRNQTNRNIRHAKADYIKDKLDATASDSSKFWRIMRDIIPGKKTKTKGNITLLHENVEVEKLEVANFINTYFVNVGNQVPGSDTHNTITENKIPQPIENQKIDMEDKKEITEDFSLEQISNEQVLKLVKDINITKSSGISDLSSKLLKEAFKALSKYLTFLFNLSIGNLQYPGDWKKALVIPIPKQGDLRKVTNYRPISLLPLPGKILEKLVHAQLTNYLEGNELIEQKQFGFRKERSTMHAVSCLANHVNISMNKSAVTVAIFIDFKKAFDCVQHEILLRKLSTLNLNGDSLQWVKDYLRNRSQTTLANGVKSESLQIKQGVPQGSTLGPLFYILYANDLANTIRESKSIFYADDTVIYITKKDLRQALEAVQKDLRNMGQWCKANGIHINTDKTKFMLFGSAQKLATLETPNIKIDNTKLERVTSYTYLGIKLDEQLTFNLHAHTTINKVSNKLYQMRRLRPMLNDQAAILMYKNMILPILEYGDIFLTATTQSNRKKLQTLQNRALKCALNKPHLTPSTEIHVAAKLNKLIVRKKHHILLHMYQKSKLPNFTQWKTNMGGVRTRLSKKRLMFQRKPRTEKFKNICWAKAMEFPPNCHSENRKLCKL